VTSSDLAWNLTIELRASQNLYETVRFRKQDPLTLTMAILSAIVSMMGIWKSIFSYVEVFVSTLRGRCTRHHRMRQERRDSGFEMDDPHGTLAKVLGESPKHTESNPNDVADKLKNERNERMEAIEDVLQSVKQQEQTIRELTHATRQQQQAAQQAAQQLKQTIQQQQLTIEQLQQSFQQQQLTNQKLQQSFQQQGRTIEELQAVISSLRGI
jgi:hypothetical protein